MAKITGILKGSDEPLQLVFIQIDVNDPEDQKRPARLKSFGNNSIVTGQTDKSGRFELNYKNDEESAHIRAMPGRTVLQAFSDGKLVWQSPIGPWGPDIVIDGDIFLPPRPTRTYDMHGHITTCGLAANGYRVTGYEVTAVGSHAGGGACLLGSPNNRLLGTSVLDQNGRYEISYQPAKAPMGACGFIASLFIEVSSPTGDVVWTSDVVDSLPILIMNHELLDNCDANATLIQVVNQFGQSISGAEVIAEDQTGITNEAGYLSVSGLIEGQQLAARKLLVEHETNKQQHSRNSNKNWNFRSYYTSVNVSHDGLGDNVSLGIDSVQPDTAVHVIRLLPSNILVGFNLVVSVEWDASEATLRNYRDRFFETSELLYNATDGQFCIEQVSIVDNARQWDTADVRIYTSINRRSNATLDGINKTSGRIRMNPIDAFFPGTLLHELGHYLFGVHDEYKEGSDWDPANGPSRCTLASTGTAPQFAEGGGKDSCLMRGARFGAIKKFCSTHPANPHVHGTGQGDRDCWSVILEKYSPQAVGLPNATYWRPRGPVQRGAIVDRLPDSGVLLGTVTNSPPGVTDPLSFIPFKPWKPTWQISSVERDGECPDLIVRGVRNGIPARNMNVYLKTSQGHVSFQGQTRQSAGQLGDGTTLQEGEMIIRGAHIGDQITISGGAVNSWLVTGSALVAECGPVLQVEISLFGSAGAMNVAFDDTNNLVVAIDGDSSTPMMRIAVDDIEQPAMIHLVQENKLLKGILRGGKDDSRIELDALFTEAGGALLNVREAYSIQNVSPWIEATVRSADGQVELDLLQGSVPNVGRIAIREVHTAALEIDGWALAAGPFHVFATFGDELCRKAILHLQPGDSRMEKPKENTLKLVKLEEKGEKWDEIKISSFNDYPIVLSAKIDQLGTYALIEKIQGTYKNTATPST